MGILPAPEHGQDGHGTPHGLRAGSGSLCRSSSASKPPITEVGKCAAPGRATGILPAPEHGQDGHGTPHGLRAEFGPRCRSSSAPKLPITELGRCATPGRATGILPAPGGPAPEARVGLALPWAAVRWGTVGGKGSVEETKKGDEMSESGASETGTPGLKVLISGSDW
jgi:hypothetical protein